VDALQNSLEKALEEIKELRAKGLAQTGKTDRPARTAREADSPDPALAIARQSRLDVVAKIRSAKDRLLQLREEKERFEAQRASFESRSAEQEAAIARLREEIAERDARLQALEAERENHRAEIEELRLELGTARIQNAEFAKQCDSLLATIDEISAALDAFEPA
jgi:chromosome segregation ATPase